MKKILVIQNKRIGDVLISSVIANNMKLIFPDSHITYFVYDYTTGVLENNPNIDRIIAVNDKELKKLSNLIKEIINVRKSKYDIIFDSYAKFQSRMMCLFSRAEYRIGFKRPHKKLRLPFYTHPIDFLPKRTKVCGKAIENRLNLIQSVFHISNPNYEPLLFLSEEEKNYNILEDIKNPVLMLGVLGSTPIKSMPYNYMATLIDFITENYKVTILFNYAPHQKEEALKVYQLCKNKTQINLNIYENSIRGFVHLMNTCDLLVSNEGGSVHIAKALRKPTFTMYSPYIEKEDWNSFEDGINNNSVHLLDEKPELYSAFTRKKRKEIEKNPEAMYNHLTPELILEKLAPFLQHHLKSHKK